MTQFLLRVLLLLPVALGLPALALAGALDSSIGVGLTAAALAVYLHLAVERALRPRRALARRARQLAPGGVYDGDEWRQIDTCMQAMSRHRDSDRARIRELEARLHRAQASADSADRAKRSFLANIGHEIRTPLNVIVGMTRLALKQAATPQQREHLQQVDWAADRLLLELNNMLDVAKLEAGDLRVEHCAFNTGDLLHRLIAASTEGAQRRGLILRSELDPRLPTTLLGDSARLHQVLDGLLDNALKFTQVGEVVIACTLLEHTRARALIGFEVRDTGIGIPAEDQQTLFEVFRQGDASIRRRHGGSGLGLNLCNGLVRAMGGSLHIDSRRGIGSSFRFELPLCMPEHPAKQAPSERQFSSLQTPSTPAPARGGTHVRLRGGGQLQRRLLERFRLDHGDFISAYLSLQADGDRFGAAQLAHALESAAASVGALELRAAATQLAVKRRAQDDPTPELEQVDRLLQDLLPDIDARLADAVGPRAKAPARAVATADAPLVPEAATSSTADWDVLVEPKPTPLHAEVRQLAELLGNFDAAAINAFRPVGERLRGLIPTEGIDALRDAINGFDFATATDRLREVAKDLGVPLHRPH